MASAETIWALPNGDCGACGNGCANFSDVKKIWNTTCSPTDVSLTMENLDKGARGVCSSLSTEGTCDFKKGALKDLQVTLFSKGCNTPSSPGESVWVAPLWMTPSQNTGTKCKWTEPQEQSGEIDFFERGCVKNNGFLLSYGSGGDYIRTNAWGEAGHPDETTNFTAFVRFDQEQDVIQSWKCPVTTEDLSKLSGDTLTERCGSPDVQKDYYSRTNPKTSPDCLFHLVTDIWNGKDGPTPYCSRGQDSSTECQFKISGLKMGFTEPPGDWASKPCKHLLRDQ